MTSVGKIRVPLVAYAEVDLSATGPMAEGGDATGAVKVDLHIESVDLVIETPDGQEIGRITDAGQGSA